MIACRLGLAVVIATLGFGTGHAAQSGSDLFTGFQANSKDPIQVDAKTLEIYEENKQRISVFSGNVVVTRGPTILKATSMKLFSAIGGKDAAGKDVPGKDTKTSGFSR